MNSTIVNRYIILEVIDKYDLYTRYLCEDKVLNNRVIVDVFINDDIVDPILINNYKKLLFNIREVYDYRLVRILDIIDNNSVVVIVKEYYHGNTLYDILKNNSLTFVDKINIYKDILDLVDKFHSAGFICKNISSNNILLDENNNIKFLSLGCEFINDNIDKNSKDIIDRYINYFSIEFIMGDKFSIKSDIYALGVLLYEILTGVRPFDDINNVNIAFKHIKGDLSNIDYQLPEFIINIILKAINRNLNERYSNISVLLNELNYFLYGQQDKLIKQENIEDTNIYQKVSVDDSSDLNLLQETKVYDKNLEDYIDDNKEFNNTLDQLISAQKLKDTPTQEVYNHKLQENNQKIDDNIVEEINDNDLNKELIQEVYNQELDDNINDDHLLKRIRIIRIKPKVLITISVFCLLFVGLYSLNYLNIFNNNDNNDDDNDIVIQELIMPNVVDMDIDNALILLKDLNIELLPENITYIAIDSIEKGIIISSNYKQGDIINEDSELKLEVSNGTFEIMKDYIGYNIDDALSELSVYKHLNIIKQSKATNEFAENTIIAQEGILGNQEFDTAISNRIILVYAEVYTFVIPMEYSQWSLQKVKDDLDLRHLIYEVKKISLDEMTSIEKNNYQKGNVVRCEPAFGNIYSQQGDNKIVLYIVE